MLALAQLIAGNADSAPDPTVVLLTERALQPLVTKALEVQRSWRKIKLIARRRGSGQRAVFDLANSKAKIDNKRGTR
jgi:hypothetical protein